MRFSNPMQRDDVNEGKELILCSECVIFCLGITSQNFWMEGG